MPLSVWFDVCDQLQAYNNDFGPIGSSIICDQVSGQIYATGSCANFETNFNVTMQFSTDAIFVMAGSSMVYESKSLLGLTQCNWSIQSVGDHSEFVIGETFFKQFYTIFDNNNGQVGFGVSSSYTQQDSKNGPWILDAVQPPSNSSALFVVVIAVCTILFIAGIAYAILKTGKKKPEKSRSPRRMQPNTQQQVSAMVGSGAETATFGNHLSGELP